MEKGSQKGNFVISCLKASQRRFNKLLEWPMRTSLISLGLSSDKKVGGSFKTRELGKGGIIQIHPNFTHV